MSGSLQKFIYRDDAGFSKIVNLDESNCREIGYTPATVAEVGLAGIPARVSTLNGNERYILLSGITTGGRAVRRKIVVPRADNAFFTDGGAIALDVSIGTGNSEAVLMQVTRAVGEAKAFALLGTDTGLDDTTQP